MSAAIVNDMSRFIVIELPGPATDKERKEIAERVAAALEQHFHDVKRPAQETRDDLWDPHGNSGMRHLESADVTGDMALAPLMCPRHDCESTRHALNQLRVENKHLRAEIERLQRERDALAAKVASYERMFHSAVAALAEISDALGIPEDVASTANGNAEILHAIRALLKERDALAAKVASYERADRDLNEALNMGDGSYRP